MENILLKSLLTEAKDVKIYLKKGEKPPKGKKAVKGPKGGMYFMGTPQEKKDREGGKKPAAKPKVNIFDKPKSKVAPKKKETPKPTAKPKATRDSLNKYDTEPVGLNTLKSYKNNSEQIGDLARRAARKVEKNYKFPANDVKKMSDKRIESSIKSYQNYIKRTNQIIARLDKLPDKSLGKWTNLYDKIVDNMMHQNLIDDLKKELESRKGGGGKGNLTPEQHQDELDKIGMFSGEDQKKYINDHVSKPIPDKVLDDLLDTKMTFMIGGQPETYSEMKEAGRMAKRYYKILDKYPELEKLGFSVDDVYDPTEDF